MILIHKNYVKENNVLSFKISRALRRGSECSSGFDKVVINTYGSLL